MFKTYKNDQKNTTQRQEHTRNNTKNTPEKIQKTLPEKYEKQTVQILENTRAP